MAKAVGPQGAEGLASAYFRDWPGPLLSGIASRLTNVLGGSRDPSRHGTKKARCTRLSKTRPGPPPAGDAPTGAIPGVRNASPAQPRGCGNTPPSLRDSSGGEGARNMGEASFCSRRPSLQAGDLPGPCTRQAQACCRPGGQERSPCHSLPARHACAMNAPDGWGRGRLLTGEETLTRQTAVNSRRKEEGQGRRGRGGRGGRLLSTHQPDPGLAVGPIRPSGCYYDFTASWFSNCVLHFQTRSRGAGVRFGLSLYGDHAWHSGTNEQMNGVKC